MNEKNKDKLEEKKELKEEEILIECTDGKKRTRQEYNNWIDELVMKYN